MTDDKMAPPDGGAWWFEDDVFGVLGRRDHPIEHCHNCGRLMVETIEAEGYMPDGRRKYHRWHSCPRYLVSSWKAAFLPGYGGGHDSHDADEPMLGREWR